MIKNKKLSEYNKLYKEYDDIYRGICRAYGLSECTFWILYLVRDNTEEITQSEICDFMYQPKQTVNSALKKLESEEYIQLVVGEDKRSRKIHLTDKGIKLSEKTVDKVMEAEADALARFTEEEYEQFKNLFIKFQEVLKNNINEIYPE